VRSKQPKNVSADPNARGKLFEGEAGQKLEDELALGVLKRHGGTDYVTRETGKPFEPVGLEQRTNLQATEYDLNKGKPRPSRSVPPGTVTPPSSQAAIRVEAKKTGLPEPKLPKQEGPFPEEAGQSPEMAALFGRTMGRQELERPSLWTRMKEGIRESFIPYHKIQGPEFAPVRDRLRILHGTQRNYREIASSQIEHILGPKAHFDARDYKLFSMKAFADELAESALRKGDSFAMPGVTKDEALAFARSEQARLEPFLEKNKAVRDAYRRHLELTREIGNELAKRELIKPELRQYYLHHQVLDFMREAYGGRELGERFTNIKRFLESKPKTGPPGIREYRPGQLKERTQGVKDISRDYLRVMYEYLATTQEAIKRFDTLQEIIGLYDKSKEFGGTVPPGYAKYDFQKGFSAFRGENAVERMFGEALDGIMPDLARTFGLDVKASTMLERQLMPGVENIRPRRDAIIPEQLAETLMEAAAARPKLSPVERALEKGNRFFKNLVLHKLPFQYNIRNFNGDFQRGLAQFGPEMFHMDIWKRSFQEVMQALKNKNLSPFMNYAQEYNITSSGRTATEISRVNEATQFQHLFRSPGEDAPLGQKVAWIYKLAKEFLPRVSTAREDLMRIYIAKLNLERVGKKQPLLSGVVDIQGLENDPVRATAKIAREALGDYGNFTPFENKMRNGVFPFYSWAAINLSFWPKLVGATVKGAVSPGSAASGALLKGFTMMVGMSLAARVWNDVVMEDAERALPKHLQESNHIILPDPEQAAQGKFVPWVERDSRGKAKIMTLAVPDALDDFLTWTGTAGVAPELKHVFAGRMSWKEYLQRRSEDAIYRDGVPLPSVATGIGNMLGPLVQVPVAAAGYQLFPDPLHPREVLPGDKLSAVASAAGLSGIPGVGSKFPGVGIGLQGQPAKGVGDISGQLGFTEAPGGTEDRFLTDTRIDVERINNEIQRVGSAMGRIKAEVSSPGLDETDRANRVRQLDLKRKALIGEIRRKVQRLNDLRQRADRITLPQ
jgi:hypothetical protein